jgi:hypothetical protein
MQQLRVQGAAAEARAACGSLCVRQSSTDCSAREIPAAHTATLPRFGVCVPIATAPSATDEPLQASVSFRPPRERWRRFHPQEQQFLLIILTHLPAAPVVPPLDFITVRCPKKILVSGKLSCHGHTPKSQSSLILETEGGEWLKPAVLKAEIAGSLSDRKLN